MCTVHLWIRTYLGTCASGPANMDQIDTHVNCLTFYNLCNKGAFKFYQKCITKIFTAWSIFAGQSRIIPYRFAFLCYVSADVCVAV